MAHSHQALLLLMLQLGLAPSLYHALAPAPAPTPAPAPAPAPAFCNITQIIESAGQFLNFLQLLSDTKVGEKFQSQANQTHIGITIFAPLDKAFARAPASTLLRNITATQKVSLCEYHALPRWYSLASLQQTKNNVSRTYAGGEFTLNVTDDNGNVNIKTGWSSADITSTLYNAEPCSIFAIDEVLLPEDIFGLPAPTPAPAPSAGAPLISPSTSSPSSPSGTTPSAPASTDTSRPSSQPNLSSPSLPPFQALLFFTLLLSFL